MRRFAELYARLDASTATSAKVEALAAYFAAAPAADAAWAVYVLTGRKLKRLIKSGELRDLAAQASGYPPWLIEDSYSHVGDLAETIDLLLDAPREEHDAATLADWIEQRLAPLPTLGVEARAALLLDWWRQLPHAQRFVLNKLLTGSLRVGVSQRLVVQGLARASGLDTAQIAHRLSGDWQPSAEAFRALLDAADVAASADQPYPFFLASPWEQPIEQLGTREDWLAEWKWDGIRAQLLKRDGRARLWSRGEERLDGRFPEIETAAATLPDGIAIDGEILVWRDGAPLAFGALQKRIGRLKPGAKLLADNPVVLLAYDLLEQDGRDLRTLPLHERRARLERLLAGIESNTDAPSLFVSAPVDAPDWTALAARRDESRARGVEGLMLKRLDSPYQVGRRRGDWWKWKIDPYTLDAVLIYAQAGHGRRSNLYTDYTFAVWDGDALVPVAKAYSGLSDVEIGQLDRWIRSHTLERFGPVRSVEPHHVFELAFEAINASSRHKSGVAVRFPRILRWRQDLAIRDADSLDQLKTLARG
ncbi:MAG: ATP-dependent DNA ligase [Dokdonella sp.]